MVYRSPALQPRGDWREDKKKGLRRLISANLLIVLVVVLVLDFDRYWLGERKAGNSLNEASVRIALASRTRESMTRTRTSTIEEVEPLNLTAPGVRRKTPQTTLIWPVRRSILRIER